MVSIIMPYGTLWDCLCRTKDVAMRDEHGLKMNVKSKSAVRRKLLPSGKRRSGNSYALLLGLEVGQTPALLKRIKEGLGYNSWENFIRNTDLRKEDAISLVQISSRTLARRKGEGRLHPDESDRLIRAARIFELTSELFDGDIDSARKWLTAAQPALGGSTPIEYASTEVGAREVESLIGRLEHGIPS